MNYAPNISDPRVLKRVKIAYGFARGVLSETKPHSWSTRYIDKFFGQQQNPLSKWLRQQLLIVNDHHFNKDAGITKKYLLNTEGADHIRQLLQGETKQATPLSIETTELTPSNKTYDEQMVNHWLVKEFGSELSSHEFSYEDKSNRLWHPLQSVRREYKRPILSEHGLQYHYDIQAAAPTLIHQHAQQQPNPMPMYLFALRRYLTDREQIRTEIAQALEIDIKTAKVLINALFCGARIGQNSDFAITKLLGNDPARVEYLKQDPFITELRNDIKTCWEYIQPSMTRKSIIDKNNKQRLLPVSSREKWSRYFDLERKVLNAVIKYMRANSMGYFLEHDGWSCDRVIDVNELSDYVFGLTGLRVTFEGS